MRRGGRRIRAIFYLGILLAVVLVGYKIYLNVFEPDFEAVHAAQIGRIETALAGRDAYRFAVVGNINNSIGIFERKLIPMLNASGVDFVVSAGNAVSSGGEDKYRALYRTLARLEMPYLLTFGEHENTRLGSFRFYDHFGPYVYAFSAADSRFLFLDSTGKTSPEWQLQWLEEELAAGPGGHAFVFSGHPLRPVAEAAASRRDADYLFAGAVRSRLAAFIEEAGVDAVFSATLPLFVEGRHGATRHVVTGGAGGFVPDGEHGFYHYVEVAVEGAEVRITPRQIDTGQHALWRTLEGLWFAIHSLFYVGYLNFLLLVSALLVIALWLYQKIFVERDYYPNFDLEPESIPHRPLRVAMFTNNYLPFVGGVPLSIERLRRGLTALGHQVLVVAPAYDRAPHGEAGIIRVHSLLSMGEQREFRLANIFSPRLYRQVLRYRPDLVHVHHPFWLGCVGVWLARRLKVPVVFTYHTRLEHYAHYVPLPGPLFRNLVSHALVRRFANRCDGVVVPTESAEEYLRLIGVRRPVCVQPTGIEYARFQAVTESQVLALRRRLRLGDDTVLICITRLSPEKNIDFMLDAIGDLARRRPAPFRFLIIGDGVERDRLQARIEDEGLADCVALLGTVPPEEIPVYCRLGDVFLFASRSETQGMVILEAMAAGLPVVAVRSSGINDIVQDGVNGFRTPLDPARWRERVERLLMDRGLRDELSRNARVVAADYDIDRFSRNIAHCYALVLAGFRRERGE